MNKSENQNQISQSKREIIHFKEESQKGKQFQRRIKLLYFNKNFN